MTAPALREGKNSDKGPFPPDLDPELGKHARQFAIAKIPTLTVLDAAAVGVGPIAVSRT